MGPQPATSKCICLPTSPLHKYSGSLGEGWEGERVIIICVFTPHRGGINPGVSPNPPIHPTPYVETVDPEALTPRGTRTPSDCSLPVRHPTPPPLK